MRNSFRYLFLSASILLVAASCKREAPNETKYIPKDAIFVFDLNWRSLSDKARQGNINWDSLVKANTTDMDTSIVKAKKEFENFMHSGIDTTGNVYFFVKTGGSVMEGQHTSEAVVVALKNPSSFETYVKKHDNAPQIQRGDNFSYASLGEGWLVGWNKDVVILSGAQTVSSKMNENQQSSPSSNSSDQQTLSALFNQKEQDAITSIPEFQDLMEQKGDMLFWSNSSSILSSNPIVGMTKFADLFKGSYGAGTVNFEDGKVVADYKSYSGKDLADILNKYKSNPANMDLVNRYPSPVSGFAAFSFNPQIITEIIKYGGLDATANEYMQKIGLTMDDVTKAFKGDFAIVVSDVSPVKPYARFLFDATIGDKASYDKVVSALAQQGLMEMKNGQYVPAEIGNDIAWNMDGKDLIIASDNSLVQQYLSGKGNAAIPADIANNSKDKAAAFYADINKILQSLSANSDSSDHAAMDAAKSTFKNVTGTTTTWNGKYFESNFELNTMNNNENSLASLIRFFASVSQKIAREEQRLKGGGMMDMNMPPTDSTTTIAPPDESK